ncbi:hypothetical protein DFQ27_007580 [Actinomortierella ambigua]|uniref:Cyanovirin-N domain-containing protein n=1 Tax=Actinomortierella ambigua TaxID=1343610 RepID=A0A9P6QL29_9FUNG|nr:hypothetical protein DFQ26_006794 [Actinomortierella ambigua]KAG0268076.1 hypothetical protein DFQ27_007580 [Actinomortierella ambigua]
MTMILSNAAELAWGHTKFSRHAKRIKVSGSATLHAEVKDHRGHYHHSSLELHQRIFNKNGRLVYKH